MEQQFASVLITLSSLSVSFSCTTKEQEAGEGPGGAASGESPGGKLLVMACVTGGAGGGMKGGKSQPWEVKQNLRRAPLDGGAPKAVITGRGKQTPMPDGPDQGGEEGKDMPMLQSICACNTA